MEALKNPRKYSSEFSRLNFTIGLVISLLVVICAFEWKSYVVPIEVPETKKIDVPFSGVQVIQIPEPKVTMPKPQPINPPLADKVKVVDNNVKVDIIKVDPIEIPVTIDVDNYKPVEEKAEDPPFVSSAEVPAEFDYNMSFSKYVSKKFRLPSSAKGISGIVYVQFIVDIDGSLTDVEILKGLSPKIDEEALRVVRSSPKWIPARQGNRIVRLRMILPIVIATPAK